MVKPINIRLVLTVAMTRDWKVCQIVIGNAFLNGVLDERILMKEPTGFIDSSVISPSSSVFVQEDHLWSKTVFTTMVSVISWF